MAAVDSSAPETTSSDNSPTTSRGTFLFRLPKGMTPGAAFVTSGGSTSVARRRNGDSSSDCLSSSTGEESRSTAGASSSNRVAGYSVNIWCPVASKDVVIHANQELGFITNVQKDWTKLLTIIVVVHVRRSSNAHIVLLQCVLH